MACNSYRTYPSCGGCGSWNRDIYFPDFVANRCCNPCCSGNVEAAVEGCNICNGGGWNRPGGCWNNNGGCGCHNGWDHGCCRGCRCGCQNGCGCQGGCDDDLFGCPTPIQPRF